MRAGQSFLQVPWCVSIDGDDVEVYDERVPITLYVTPYAMVWGMPRSTGGPGGYTPYIEVQEGLPGVLRVLGRS